MSRLPGRLLTRLTPTGRRALAVAGAAVGVLLVAAGTALATSSPEPGAPGQSATVTARGASRALLRVTSRTPLLRVRVASGTGGPLVQAQTPEGAPVRPVLKETGALDDTEVDLSLASGGGSGSGSDPVTVTLNPGVTWALDFGGGTQRTVADLRGGRIALLVFTAGSSDIDVTLPRPGGTVPLILAGGASQLRVGVPAGVPVQVTADSGAGDVTLDGTTRTGIAGGTVLTTPDWPAAGPRVEIDASSGAAQIAVTAWKPAPKSR
jgi:hypothetical protein